MRAVLREPRWNPCILIISIALAAWAPSPLGRTIGSAGTTGASIPTGSGEPSDADLPSDLSSDDTSARAFLEEWLTARGYPCPDFEVSAAGVPKGADAATFCKGKACVIRIRPESLHAPIANARIDGNSLRQWQNLLLHEAVHYIDIQRRGKSDHGLEFRKLARGFGVAYQP